MGVDDCNINHRTWSLLAAGKQVVNSWGSGMMEIIKACTLFPDPSFNYTSSKPACSQDRSLLFVIVIFLDFHSTKQGLPLVDSWSHGLD